MSAHKEMIDLLAGLIRFAAEQEVKYFDRKRRDEFNFWKGQVVAYQNLKEILESKNDRI